MEKTDTNQLIADLKKEKRALNLRVTMLERKVAKLTEENKNLTKENREIIKTNHQLCYELYGNPE